MNNPIAQAMIKKTQDSKVSETDPSLLIPISRTSNPALDAKVVRLTKVKEKLKDY
jgi:hypothetical protein